MKVKRFKCLYCGALRRDIHGAPARCPTCRKVSAWLVVEIDVKEDRSRKPTHTHSDENLGLDNPP